MHEETQASPEWGDRVTPDILVAMRDKKLLPVADLDRGFVRPEYEAQVIVSYYQAGRICDYIQNRWGADKLLEMVHSFAKVANHRRRDPTGSRHVGWTNSTSSSSPGSTTTSGKTAANFDQWHKSLKELAEAAKEHRNDDVITGWPADPRPLSRLRV